MSDQNSNVFVGDDDFDAFDASDDGGGLPGLFVLVAGVLVLLTFSAVVWVAYQQGLRQGGRESPPVVVADPGPIKVPAREEGAAQVAEQREVFDRLDQDAPPRTEQLARGPEEPIERSRPNGGVTTPITASATRPAAAETSTAPENTPVQTPPAPEQALAAASRPDRDPPASQGTTSAARNDGLVEIPPPPSRNARPASAGAPAPAASRAAGATAGESYVVQIAAFRSQDEAMTSWSRMQSRFPELMSGVRPDIQRADLGEKGIYYRLRVGFFSDKARADAFCGDLKDAGQGCLVRRR